MDWATKEFEFNSRQERDISVFSTAFRRVLGFIQFSAPSVMGTSFGGDERPRRDSDNTPACSRKIKNMWSQTSTRYNFSCHYAKLSTGTPLHLPLTLQFWSRCTLRPFIPQSVLRHPQTPPKLVLNTVRSSASCICSQYPLFSLMSFGSWLLLLLLLLLTFTSFFYRSRNKLF